MCNKLNLSLHLWLRSKSRFFSISLFTIKSKIKYFKINLNTDTEVFFLNILNVNRSIYIQQKDVYYYMRYNIFI